MKIVSDMVLNCRLVLCSSRWLFCVWVDVMVFSVLMVRGVCVISSVRLFVRFFVEGS